MNTEYPSLNLPFQGRKEIDKKLYKDNIVNIFFKCL
jgi:hypothetical protein